MARRRGNNEGTIYPRPNGTYRAQISLDGHRLSYNGQTRKACQDWLHKTRGRIDDGMTYEGAKTSLEDFFGDWLTMKSTTVRHHTERQYRQITRDYILPQLGSKELLQLRPDHIQLLYNQHIEAGVSPRTVELVHSVLRGALNHAVRLGLLSRNPTYAVVPPKPTPKEMKTLDENQIQTFLIVAQSEQPEFLPLYQLALTTGMRLGELLGLSWNDLDWDRQTLSVKRQLTRIRDEGLVLTPPKTKAALRTIKLGASTWSILKSHHKSQYMAQSCRDPDWQEKDLVFTQTNGKPYGPRQVQKAYKRILNAAGLPNMRFHDLRHTAATHMIAKGVDMSTVKRRLGHTKVSTTFDNYVHAVPGMQEKAAAVIDEITTPVALPADLTAPKLHLTAPKLHPESDA